MTYEYLEVDTGKLKSAGEGFLEGATQLKAIYDRLDLVLSAEGECWGADRTGEAFAEGYKEPSKQVLESFLKFPDGLDGIKQGVDLMAKTYKLAEDASRLV